MLDLIDAEIRRLSVRDRAQMPCDFETQLMRFIDRRTQQLRRNEHVGFEAGKAPSGPEPYVFARALDIVLLIVEAV